MPRRCDLTGTTPQTGHNVSHSNRKTHRTFDVNLQNATFYSDALQRPVGAARDDARDPHRPEGGRPRRASW